VGWVSAKMRYKESSRMQRRTVLAVALVFVSLPVLSVSSCAMISHARNEAFEKIGVGQTRADVVKAFGVSPSFVEGAGVGFPRYASQPCHGRCAERMWFENRLSMDMEAWSVELDGQGRVVEKTRWHSP